EMGTGKSLAAIMAGEEIGGECMYVGPRSACASFRLELKKWNAKIRPHIFTYERMTKEVMEWVSGRKAPKFLILDEGHLVKTPATKRSLAAKTLADGVVQDWGDDGYIVLMSGTPAPKRP